VDELSAALAAARAAGDGGAALAAAQAVADRKVLRRAGRALPARRPRAAFSAIFC